MTTPRCWKCGSDKVTVEFTGYAPVFHVASACTCETSPCGTVPQGWLTCRKCGNAWNDGDISEFRLEN